MLSRVKSTLLALGTIDTLCYAIDRVLRRISTRTRLYKYYFVAQAVPAGPSLPPHRGRDISVRQIPAGDPVLETFPPPAAVIAARYRQQASCLAAFRGAAPVAYAWFTLGPYQEDEVRSRFVPLPEGQAAWDFDVFLFPAARLTATFARLWDELNDLYRRKGIKWTLSRISAFNRDSRASHARLGAEIVGTVVYVVLGSVQLTFATCAPFVHVSFNSRFAPVFRIGPRRTP